VELKFWICFQDIEFPEPLVKADLFKAIFLSSSEESDSENEELPGKTRDSQRDSDSSSQPASAKSVVRNMSPPRGIFANVDLDAINARRASKVAERPVKQREKSPSPSCKDSESEEDMIYGPKLPTNNSTPSITSTLLAPSSPDRAEELWVEKDSREKHRKHKKDKKHKKHKSKKHKRK